MVMCVYELIREYDIALLFECEQIFDVDMKKQYQTRIVVNRLAKIKIPDELTHRSRIDCIWLRALSERDRLSS
ncbi:MAG: hypothetical protein ACTSVR_00560 [Candidatus Thorarchaeota archaeon]